MADRDQSFNGLYQIPTLDEVLDQDLRVGSRFLEHPDLAEGIRAMIIDKDRRPRWNPARLSEVSVADVASFFEPLPPGTRTPDFAGNR
jgi:enoyl-CoA hydratase